MFESCRGRFSDQQLWTAADSTDVLDWALAHPLAHPFRGRLTACRDRYDNAGNDLGSCAFTTGATRSPVARHTCRGPCTAPSAKRKLNSRGSLPKLVTARTRRRMVQRSASCSSNGSATTKTTGPPPSFTHIAASSTATLYRASAVRRCAGSQPSTSISSTRSCANAVAPRAGRSHPRR